MSPLLCSEMVFTQAAEIYPHLYKLCSFWVTCKLFKLLCVVLDLHHNLNVIEVVPELVA